MRYLRLSISVFLLAFLSAPVLGAPPGGYCSWLWMWEGTEPLHNSPQYGYEQLTSNNGAHAVSMTPYGNPENVWINVVASNVKPSPEGDSFVVAHQYNRYPEVGYSPDTTTIRHTSDNYNNICVSAAAEPDGRKAVMYCEYDEATEYPVRANAEDLTRIYRPWPNPEQVTASGYTDGEAISAVVMSDATYGCAVFPAEVEHDDDFYYGLMGTRTVNGGGAWGDPFWVFDSVKSGPYQRDPSICKGTGGTLHLAYVSMKYPVDKDTIIYRRGSDYGLSWSSTSVQLDTCELDSQPCIASLGDIVFVCWNRGSGNESRICYRWSEDGGESWYGRQDLPFKYAASTKYSRPSISIELATGFGGVMPRVLVTCAVETQRYSSVTAAMATLIHPMYDDPLWAWALYPWLAGNAQRENPNLYNPSLATATWGSTPVTKAIAVWSAPAGGGQRVLVDSRFTWLLYNSAHPKDADSPGRDVSIDAAGNVQFASVMGPYTIGGPVVGASVTPVMQDVGCQPALAVDGANEPWFAYLRGDSLFCKIAGDVIKPVFCGSSSAIPGQPSIVCYPEQAGGVTVANVVFAVYDTAGGTSKIMYCRVDTGQVVQDTIESVNNLRDSLPSISVYATDTLLVTFQHGDSVLSVMLADYGPGTAGQVPAWSSPSLVTANGYHPMNVMENGSVLNCVWTQKSGNYYSIQRATNDLASAMFGNWTGMATPGSSTTLETGNSVYAGVGVSVYQQKDANGKWTIRGFVRGEETTLVANDTDAYHPHAVAESSAISPSIDRIRVHLLHTAGVTFEVDSGVYDTGEVRYSQLNFDVSHAGSDATKYNNGTKLLRKAGSDSLFAVYSDADGAVAYAWSAAGDSWQREIMATGRDYPAIAEDSSGMRWVVVTKPVQGMYGSVEEAYYLSGGSWVGPETLYTNAVTTLGPASLAGASDTSTGIAYAAFLTTSGMSKSLILAKFNGSTVTTYTVATGASLGDPSLTVEPYLADSDRVHIVWEDNGIVYYRMDTDGRSSGIASNWTQTIALSDVQATSQHPSINSDRDQIVVAWAQGSPTDVYSRKRSTASAYNNWEAAANLSNTAQDASDYATIAMGDTVVVAWEEQRIGGSDFDILASIDFGDTLNIADNATFSTYPHVLFQNKVSGDTCIPYLHTVFSEAPEAEYYEVAYNKLNLKQATGEGQQSAGTPPIPAKPSLSACRPNPFRDRTQISYALPTASNVSLRVYDVSGRTVRTLASGHQKAGSYSVSWDSKDSRGRQVARGVYFYRLDTPGFRAVKKAVVTR